jgi:hypothetical protein
MAVRGLKRGEREREREEREREREREREIRLNVVDDACRQQIGPEWANGPDE